MTVQDLINAGNDVMPSHEMENYSGWKTFINERTPPYMSEFSSPCWLRTNDDKEPVVTCLPAVFLGKRLFS